MAIEVEIQPLIIKIIFINRIMMEFYDRIQPYARPSTQIIQESPMIGLFIQHIIIAVMDHNRHYSQPNLQKLLPRERSRLNPPQQPQQHPATHEMVLTISPILHMIPDRLVIKISAPNRFIPPYITILYEPLPPQMTFPRQMAQNPSAKNLVNYYSGNIGDSQNQFVNFKNQGNCCYVASILQILFPIIEKEDWPQAELLNTLSKAFFNVKEEKTIAKLKELKNYLTLRYGLFGGYLQQDANEFLVYLLDKIIEEHSVAPIIFQYDARKTLQTNYERFTILQNQNQKCNFGKFYGNRVDSVTCRGCYHKNYRIESFNVVELSVQSSNKYLPLQLESMLNDFLQTEQILDYACLPCRLLGRKVNGIKRSTLCQLPQYLLLTINRSIKNPFNVYIKSETPVKIAKQINVSQSLQKQYPSNLIRYEIISILNHIGPSVSSGHYNTISLIKNIWRFFDTKDYPKAPRTILNPFENGYYLNDNVVMLVYKRL